jgi:hypothetical protein
MNALNQNCRFQRSKTLELEIKNNLKGFMSKK